MKYIADLWKFKQPASWLHIAFLLVAWILIYWNSLCFFFFFFFLIWRIITLQNWVGFCQTSIWTSHSWVPLSFSCYHDETTASHSSNLAWKIPWMEQLGRLQSMGSFRVRHDWATSHSLFTFMHWRRKWQPTPVFLPGESQGQGSLVGCHLWGHTESDTTDMT